MRCAGFSEEGDSRRYSRRRKIPYSVRDPARNQIGNSHCTDKASGHWIAESVRYGGWHSVRLIIADAALLRCLATGHSVREILLPFQTSTGRAAPPVMISVHYLQPFTSDRLFVGVVAVEQPQFLLRVFGNFTAPGECFVGHGTLQANVLELQLCGVAVVLSL